MKKPEICEPVERSRRCVLKSLFVLLAALSLWPVSVLGEINFYIGAGVGATNIDSSGLQSAAENVGLVASDETDKTAFGGQIFAGAMFTRHFGIEGKYSDSGDADDTITVFDPNAQLSMPVNVDASIDGYTFYGVATIPFPKRAEISLKLGYTVQDADVSIDSSDMSASVSTDDDGVAVAGLLRIWFGEHWAVTGELEYFHIDFSDSFDEPIRFSINGEYRF
jgi:hypothetical protein